MSFGIAANFFLELSRNLLLERPASVDVRNPRRPVDAKPVHLVLLVDQQLCVLRQPQVAQKLIVLREEIVVAGNQAELRLRIAAHPLAQAVVDPADLIGKILRAPPVHRREVARHQHEVRAARVKPLQLPVQIGYRVNLHLS